MWCTNCGQPIPDGAGFCRECGTPVDTSATPPAEPPAGVTPPPPPAATAPPPPPPPPPPVAQSGYGGAWQPQQGPQQGPPPKRNRTGIIVGSVVAAVILLAGLGVGLFFGLRSDDSSASNGPTRTLAPVPKTTSTTAKAFTLGEGEIFLEPAGSAGPESFTGELFVSSGPPSTLHFPTELPFEDDWLMDEEEGLWPDEVPDPADTSVRTVASLSGDTRGLYGGSMSKTLVDKEAQVEFFATHPAEAAAFCAALNADPTLRWSGGSQVRPEQLPDYFAELTPLMLIHDTRVTNHGFRNGKPTPRQAVLQKGQMVLVDAYGVPRVRCECGNPLIPPVAVTTGPVYVGDEWPEFDPGKIVVVEESWTIIEIFVTIDIDTGETFGRPAGTDGEEDTLSEPFHWEFAMDLDWLGYWMTDIWLADDGSIMGGDPVSSHVGGNTFDDTGKTGEWWADVSFVMTIAGEAEDTPYGRILHLRPSFYDLEISNMGFDTTGDMAALAEGLPANISMWLESAMVPIGVEVYGWEPAETELYFQAEMEYRGWLTLMPLD